MNRGIESFFREAFDNLKELSGLDSILIKGGGPQTAKEHVASCLPRTSSVAAFLGNVTQRTPYVIEQWTSFYSVVRLIRRFRPDVIFFSDANLGFLLYRFRNWVGVSYRLLYSNGGPVRPPFTRVDFVHQVAPLYYTEALRSGEPDWKHILLPYGIRTGAPPVLLEPESRSTLRYVLRLPVDRPVILSVGWISSQHKRMDYTIQEVARLPRPRPFLMLLGAMDESSREIVDLGRSMLGNDGFAARSVPYEQVADYYRAADCFVLASLQEGFGRVYIEALTHGLPVLAHRHPVTEFVLGGEGVLLDLTRPGALATALADTLITPTDSESRIRRWRSVASRFSWSVLAPHYRAMFEYVGASSAPGKKATERLSVAFI